MSSTATLIPLLINLLTTSSPIPLQPPVMTATSRLQFHLAFSLRNLPEFRAMWLSCLLTTLAVPAIRHHFKAFKILAYL